MRWLRLLLMCACVAAGHPASADAPAPRKDASRPELAARRTGRMPARFDVTPADAAKPPAHIVVTIPRERLRLVMAGASADVPVEGPVGDVVVTPPPDRLRHYAAAAALTLAVLSLPLLAGRIRRGRALALAVLALLVGVAFVRADIAAPPGGPQTVEVIVVPGNGPVQVQLAYPPRR